MYTSVCKTRWLSGYLIVQCPAYDSFKPVLLGNKISQFYFILSIKKCFNSEIRAADLLLPPLSAYFLLHLRDDCPPLAQVRCLLGNVQQDHNRRTGSDEDTFLTVRTEAWKWRILNRKYYEILFYISYVGITLSIITAWF